MTACHQDCNLCLAGTNPCAEQADHLAKQKAEWEAHKEKDLLAGLCPYSGEELVPTMDAWQRRMLMCDMCDCFGYPLVVSDAGDTYGVLHPEIDRRQRERAAGLTDSDLDW